MTHINRPLRILIVKKSSAFTVINRVVDTFIILII
jgi:hypothetical protein